MSTISLTGDAWEREVIGVHEREHLGTAKFTAATLPDPATIEAGAAVVVDGNNNIVSRGTYIPTYVESNSLAVVGDSFTANAWSSSDTIIRWMARGYITAAMAMSNHRLNIVPGGMCAVGGSGVTGDINGVAFDTQLTSAIATGARNLIVMGGVNDVKEDISPNVIISSYKALVTRAVRAGMRVFVCTQPCRSDTSSLYTVARQGAMLAVQQAMRMWCAKQNPQNVILVDTAAAYIDPTSTTASPKANYVYSSDGTHPTNAGAYFMGKVLADAINSVVPNVPSALISNADCVAYSPLSRNLISNGLMVNSTGGLATGFTTAASGTLGTLSVAARSDGLGNNQIIPFTYTAAGQYVRFNFPTVSSGISDGDIIYAEAEVTLTNPVNVANARFVGTMTCSLQTVSSSFNELDSTNDVAFITGYTYLMRTEPIKYNAAIHGTFKSFDVRVQLGAGAAASGSGSFSVGRAAVWRMV